MAAIAHVLLQIGFDRGKKAGFRDCLLFLQEHEMLKPDFFDLGNNMYEIWLDMAYGIPHEPDEETPDD